MAVRDDFQIRLELGSNQARYNAAMGQLVSERVLERIWKRDATLWKPEESHQAVIRKRLGWVDSPVRFEDHLRLLSEFTRRVQSDKIRHVVILGMGGSSLCPEVFRRSFRPRPGYPRLIVLDTTHPATIRSVEKEIDLRRALFIVASKSGTTIESDCLLRYFFDRVREKLGEEAGSRFIAVTDPGTSLVKEGDRLGFRRVFVNDPDIGGRFSALSYFGLLPMALMGLELSTVLAQAQRMAEACGPQTPIKNNPGAVLGAALGSLAAAGRNKLTFMIDDKIGALGLWLEQLVAESTGKEGRGLIPVAGESAGRSDGYGKDRLFVGIEIAGSKSGTARVLARLARAGHPVVRMALANRFSLGAEFYRWEMATAVAGYLLGVNPFDEPNVAESKANTAKILDRVSLGDASDPSNNAIPVAGDPKSLVDRLAAFFSQADPGTYVALQAYLPYREATEKACHRIRSRIRSRLGVATTFGYGPRFLHSTGQLHKGGPPRGLFLQLIADPGEKLSIPNRPFRFDQLIDAQALGDYRALEGRGRPVLRIHLGDSIPDGMRRLEAAVSLCLARISKRS